jgi:hypothetical protein
MRSTHVLQEELKMRHYRCAIALLLTSTVTAQQPIFDLTNVSWLKNQGLDGSGVVFGQFEGSLAAAHSSFGNRVVLTQPGVPTQAYLEPGTAASVGPNGVNHATHVAGIMISSADLYDGRNSTGVCPSAELVNSNTDTPTASGANFYSGLDWLTRPPLAADIVNISWGADLANAGYRKAVDWIANQRGKLVVVACANSSTYDAAGSLGSPEDGYNVLSVGATGWRSNGLPINESNVNYNRIAWYSGVSAAFNRKRDKPDIVAPGTSFYSASGYDLNLGGTLNDYSARDGSFGFVPGGSEIQVSGCSFAAPLVAGAAGLLHQYASGKSWEVDGKAPTTLRAVFINGASKKVYNRTGRPWEAGFGNITLIGNTNPAPLDSQTGAGLLDARRTFEIFKSGNISPDVRRGGPNGPEYNAGAAPRPSQGWSRNSVYGTGDNGNGQNDLQPATEVRKGSYVTSTLVYELRMTGADPGAASDAPEGRRNLDLNVFRNGATGLVAGSAGTDGTVEHLVVKAPARDKYTFNVQSFANTPTDYTLAWHTFEAPTSTREFNGDFSGDRGALHDNGWFETTTTDAWSVFPPSFIAQPTDDSWAVSFDPATAGGPVSVAQEAFNPTGGFFLQFDVAFETNFVGGLSVKLGNLDLLALGGVPTGLIFPISGTNINQYQTFTLHYDAAAIAGLSGQFSDLSFTATGTGGRVYLDNVSYVPEPGTLAVFTLVGFLAARRQR